MSLVERMAMRMGGLALGVTAGVSETSSSTVALPLKRPTARKPQAKPKAKSKVKSKVHYEDEEDIEVESDGSAGWTDLELSEREHDLDDAQKQPSNSSKATQKTAKTAKPSSRITAKAPAVGKKATKVITSQKGANKKKVQSDVDSDLVSDTDYDLDGASDDESAMAPQQIKALPKRSVRSREARPKAYVAEDDDDDDDDDDDVSIDESEEDYVPSD